MTLCSLHLQPKRKKERGKIFASYFILDRRKSHENVQKYEVIMLWCCKKGKDLALKKLLGTQFRAVQTSIFTLESWICLMDIKIGVVALISPILEPISPPLTNLIKSALCISFHKFFYLMLFYFHVFVRI